MTLISATTAHGRRVVLAALSAGLLSACASSPMDATNPVPAALVPSDGQRPAFTWHSVGSQVYDCRADGKGRWAWVFVAPEADLFNPRGEKVGTHGAGPHWAALDGSKIIGTVKARADGQRATDIPLLLLSTTSTGASGKLASVTSVQRLNTVGGSAPAQGCDARSDVGKRIKAGYSADYVFFTAK